MKLPPVNSLYIRIFAIFWLTILLVLAAFMLVQHKDPRKTHEISKERQHYLEQFVSGLEFRLQDFQDFEQAMARINRFARNRLKHKEKLHNKSHHKEQDNNEHNTDNNSHSALPLEFKQLKSFELFLLNDHGQLLTRHHSSFGQKALRHFVSALQKDDDKGDDDTQTSNDSQLSQTIAQTVTPKQRLYRHFMLSGPFDMTIADKPVQAYIATKWKRPPKVILMMLDHPFSALVIIMLVSTPLLLWLSWNLSQPARRLEKAANRVARGEFVPEPELEKGSTEFQAAGKSFNQMVSAINHTVTAQHRLLSDISHELRSPLARLRMAAALAKRKQGESSELERIENEAEQLEQMIAELLTLSRLQSQGNDGKSQISLNQLLANLLENAQFEAEQVGKKLSYNALPEAKLFGAEPLLKSAIENVTRNAIYFANTQIKIAFHALNKFVVITIDDDGEGVPESEYQAIFQPFYRVSEARDRQSGGTGLGLAIAESAITQHHGFIDASKSELGGLKVTIRLPLST